MLNREEDILKYLTGEMSVAEKATFEQLIQKDDKLREEVEFQRGFLAFINDDEPELEHKLDQLGEEFFVKRNRRRKRLIIFMSATFVLIALLAVLLIRQRANDTNDVPNTEPTEQQLDAPMPIERAEPSELIELPAPMPSPSISTQPIASIDPKAYEPNNMMESIIQSQYRNEPTTSTTTLIKPKADEVFQAKKQVELRVEGFSIVEPPYQLAIYTNDDFEVEYDYPTLSALMKIKKEGDQFTFLYYADVPFSKGLYYIVIRQRDTRELMHITRFRVE